jgi:MFS family permease
MIGGPGGKRTVAATFVTLGLVYGIWYAYSVFLVALLRDFGWSRSVLAGAFSLFTLVHGGMSAPLGWLVARVGPRRLVLAGSVLLACGLVLDGAVQRPWQLYLAFGVVTALGVACAGWVPAVILVQRWYPHRFGTALGITGAGIGLGIAVVVPTVQSMIDLVGWRWAFRIVALVVIAWVVPATLWLIREGPGMGQAHPPPAPSAAPRDDRLLGDLVRTRGFWLLAAMLLLMSFANQMLLVHQVAYLVDRGISTLVAASVVGVIGVASIVGKVGSGFLSDVIGRRPTYTMGAGCVVLSMGVLALVAVWPRPALAYLYGTLIGIGYAAPSALSPALISDVFRSRHFAPIFGMLQVAGALGAAVGPWAAGRVFDSTGGYAPAFVLAIAGAAGATVAVWLTAPTR